MSLKTNFDLSDRTNMFYWQTNRRISALDQKRIFLDRKNTVTPEDTKAAISYALESLGRTKKEAQVTHLDESPIPYGSVNNVLKAQIADGTKLVVRMHPYFVKNGYFWVEKTATELAQKAGVPSYKTLFIDDTKQIFNFDYMITTQTPGKPLQAMWPINPTNDALLMRQTGEYMAKIHTVKTVGYGFFKNEKAKNEGNLEGQYRKLSDHIHAGLEEDFGFLFDHHVITKKQITTIEKIITDHESLIDATLPRLIHNDIADWNELADGNTITGIMDWDECFSGDPIMDFSQWSLFFDNERLKYVLEGYQQVSPIPDDYAVKDHVYRLRYVISKLHLRKKRALVMTDSTFLNERINRGVAVLAEELAHFGVR